MTDAPTAASHRGRPRSEQARLAILAAVAELLLEHGMAGVSMDNVAERAGVSKATIYRWWPTKEILALDALQRSWAESEPQPQSPDTGSLRGDLLALLLPMVQQLRSRRYGRLVVAFISESQADPAFAEQYRDCCVDPHRRKAGALFSRAAARGEIPTDADIDVALDLIWGSINQRLFFEHAPLSDAFVTDVIDVVIVGLSTMENGSR